MAAIDFHPQQVLNIAYGQNVNPVTLVHSLVDLYVPAGQSVALRAVSHPPHILGAWKFRMQWPHDDVAYEYSADLIQNDSTFNFFIEGHDFDVIRKIDFCSGGEINFYRDITEYPSDQRGHGYGREALYREIDWVRSRSTHPDSRISTHAGNIGTKPSGQFVWRTMFEFDVKSCARISEIYTAWKETNIKAWAIATGCSESILRQSLPATMVQPWSLDDCVLPENFSKYLKTHAQSEGYPGRATLAWAFWNSDLRDQDPKDKKLLSWDGCRYVNRPWNGPESKA